MTCKTLRMISWKFKEVQEALDTDVEGAKFFSVWEAAGLSKQTEILTKISNELLALEAKKKVPYVILKGEIEDEENAINSKIAEAMGSDAWDHYVTFSFDSDPNTDKVKLRVNWSCVGAQTPNVAVAFGEALTEAAYYAKSFKYNGFETVWE